MSNFVQDASEGVGRAKKTPWLDGRANRKEYWLFCGPLFVAALVVGALNIPGVTLVLGVGIFLIWIRRLHDIGRSGFLAPMINIAIGVSAFALKAFLAPDLAALLYGLISVATLVTLGVIPGAQQANRYGPPPGRKADVNDVFT